jgi:hypothetical protein
MTWSVLQQESVSSITMGGVAFTLVKLFGVSEDLWHGTVHIAQVGNPILKSIIALLSIFSVLFEVSILNSWFYM